MTDPLLDEATRLMGDYREGRLLRALVRRVQQAEAERDEARGKLDKVREAVTSVTGEPFGDDDGICRDVLAILDGKTGD